MTGTRTTRRLAACALAAALLALFPAAQARQTPPAVTPRPRLLVMLVVDQMRADYLTRLDSRFTGGFRRLLDDGAVFDQTFYPYLNTVTCAGHATIGTGAWPKTHGIIMNQWYDRAAGRERTCTDDPSVTTYTYGARPASAGHSAAALRVPTLGDLMRTRWRNSRAVTMSLKPRSAIMMAGRRATSVTWKDGLGFQSSTAYGRPRPEIASFVAAEPLTNDRGAVWNRLLPLDTYTGVDDGVGERPATGWTPLFPHPLAGTAPRQFSLLWEESPYSDAYLGRMAAAAVRGFQLGQRDTIDLLAVSFSATDHVGHSMGPESHEVQDVLLHLDRTIGTLLTTLDTVVGRDNYVLALSADHGVARVPEASRASNEPGGRVPLAAVRATVDKALAGLGAGPHVVRAEYTQVYLTPAARAKATAATMAPALAALRAMPGIDAAVWHGAMSGPIEGVPAHTLDAIRNSYDRERSGDISIVPARGWVLVIGTDPTGGDGTTHGSPHDYDQHVPLIFLGRSFPAGHYATPATPADLAPTLAATVGLPMRGIDGHAISLGRTGPTPQ